MPKIFISHASEDKETVAKPLAELLELRGLAVWLDQWELALGDSLRRSIEQALSQASFGLVILSPAYMHKKWPMRELDGLFSLETSDRNLILPVLHNIRHDEIVRRWPMLADRLSCSTDRGLEVVADQVTRAVQRVSEEGRIEQPPDAVLSEYRRRMLVAADRNELRRLLYELEDFLRHYPAHPQARILKDELTVALLYEERPAVASAPPVLASPRFGLFRLVLLMIALDAIAYFIYWLARHFLGL